MTSKRIFVSRFGNWFRDKCVEAGVPGRDAPQAAAKAFTLETVADGLVRPTTVTVAPGDAGEQSPSPVGMGASDVDFTLRSDRPFRSGACDG